VNEILEQLIRDCRSYRQAVDQILTADRLKLQGFRRCLLAIQVGIAHLQLDRLSLMQEAAVFETSSEEALPQTPLMHDMKREMAIRNRLKDRFESMTFWSRFEGKKPVAELLGLRSVDDYRRSFQLHLPEIYEETFRIENYALALLGNQASSDLTGMLVGLEHLARNHAYFVQPALDFASDEDSWTE
jgi:hypothetical protein